MRALIIFWLVTMEHTQTKEFDCSFGCGSTTLNCPSGESCIVYCGEPGEDRGTNVCRSATINCPTDADCDVFCFQSSCQYININCPTTGNCFLSCLDSACLFADVTWSPEPYRNHLFVRAGPDTLDLTLPPTRRHTFTPTSVTQSPTTATSNPTVASQHPSSAPSDTPTNDPSSDPTF
eukprot:193815_1